jgi:hypothetical protein
MNMNTHIHPNRLNYRNLRAMNHIVDATRQKAENTKKTLAAKFANCSVGTCLPPLRMVSGLRKGSSLYLKATPKMTPPIPPINMESKEAPRDFTTKLWQLSKSKPANNTTQDTETEICNVRALRSSTNMRDQRAVGGNPAERFSRRANKMVRKQQAPQKAIEPAAAVNAASVVEYLLPRISILSGVTSGMERAKSTTLRANAPQAARRLAFAVIRIRTNFLSHANEIINKP